MKTEVSSVPWRFDCDSPPIVCISDESGSFDNNYGSAPIVKQEYVNFFYFFQKMVFLLDYAICFRVKIGLPVKCQTTTGKKLPVQRI